MNFNFNFDGICRGLKCCMRITDDTIKEDLTLLRRAINAHEFPIKISMLLQKIINGKNHSGYLFELINDTEFKILDYYGCIEHQIDSILLSRNIPIVIGSTVKYILCVRGDLDKSIIV